MNIWSILYLIGCVFALIISIVEIIRVYNKDDVEKQYGLISIVILLSWVSVFCWMYGYLCNKNN